MGCWKEHPHQPGILALKYSFREVVKIPEFEILGENTVYNLKQYSVIYYGIYYIHGNTLKK